MRRVLCLDGGGIKGLFAASFLASVEADIGESVTSFFDLIVGTSTGGIIALGLGAGLSAKDIADFYESLGPRVFSNPHVSRGIFSSKYKSTTLSDALKSIIGEKRIGESRTRLVIPSMNLDTGEVYLYKTSHHPDWERDYKEPMLKAALATSAAPTYFPAYRDSTGSLLVDGGTWANNPLAVAATEAVGVLKWSAEGVQMLSLGCTAVPFDAKRARTPRAGLKDWLTFADTFFAGQSSGSLGMAQHLVGRENVIRINPVAPAGRCSLDGTNELQSLRGLGTSESRKAMPTLRRTFFGSHAEEFRPFRVLD